MLGISRRNRKTNELIRQQTEVCDVIYRTANLKWQWAGHVARLKDHRWTRKILEWKPRNTTRNRGRPPTRWTDDIKRCAGNWLSVAQDRRRWREIGEAYVQQWTRNG